MHDVCGLGSEDPKSHSFRLSFERPSVRPSMTLESTLAGAALLKKEPAFRTDDAQTNNAQNNRQQTQKQQKQ